MSTKFKIEDIRENDIFSESVHYRYIGPHETEADRHWILNVEANMRIKLDTAYITQLLTTANQYESIVEVGKEDKLYSAKDIADLKATDPTTTLREGDIKLKGIRSIWKGIYTSIVWTVEFEKQSKELSNRAFTTARTKQRDEALALIEAAKIGKKGVAKTATQVIEDLQNNPIFQTVKGDIRKLRGYKTQFESITGFYDVVDLDITTGSPLRQVNVNTITSLILDGVKYVVK